MIRCFITDTDDAIDAAFFYAYLLIGDIAAMRY